MAASFVKLLGSFSVAAILMFYRGNQDDAFAFSFFERIN